ncbi:MAG: hypothetical protein MI745_14030 [Pseudomonadales bacterium]|nr:hypothetical protein [Pseudomonadales bacterium]
MPLVIACEAFLWAQNWQLAILAGISFAIWRYDGWGEQFLAMHGQARHYRNRNKKKWVTKIADWLFVPIDRVSQYRAYGIVWGGLRGLYDLPAFIALSFLLGVPWIAPLGLLMGLQGYIYYFSRDLFGVDTAPAEWSMGIFRSTLWLIAVVL